MKRITILAVLVSLFTLGAKAQNDTMYVMKNGVVINKQSIKPSDVDSIIFYKPEVATNDTAGTFTDTRDGITYDWVKIGDQVWMAENLNYTTGNSWCYDDNAANCGTYGRLYDWQTAVAACPAGWHLPSNAEWTELTDYLGGVNVAGGKLKETGTTHWNSPNTGATNETGFTALPGGYRYNNGVFYSIGLGGRWWSATGFDATYAWSRYMGHSDGAVSRNYSNKELGFSVRCVRD